MTTVRDRLDADRRRSLADLATLRAIARGAVAPAPAGRRSVGGCVGGADLELVLTRALRALDDAAATLHGSRHPAGGRPVTRLLTVRRRRLAGLADDVLAAWRRGDLAAIRLGLYRFHALAAASWALHTGAYARLASITAPALAQSAPALHASPA